MTASPIVVSRDEGGTVRVIPEGPPGASAGPAISAGPNGPRAVLFEAAVPIAAGTLMLTDLAVTTWGDWTPPLVAEDFGTLTMPDPADRVEWRPDRPGIYQLLLTATATMTGGYPGDSALQLAAPLTLLENVFFGPPRGRFVADNDSLIEVGYSKTLFATEAMIENGRAGFYFAAPFFELGGSETGVVTVDALILDYTTDASAAIWSEL